MAPGWRHERASRAASSGKQATWHWTRMAGRAHGARHVVEQALLRLGRDDGPDRSTASRVRIARSTSSRASPPRAFRHRPCPRSSSCRHSTRSAEQRWPAECERGSARDRVDHDVLGQRRAVDQHGVDAAGLGDQRHDRAVHWPPRVARWMILRHLRRAGEHHARHAAAPPPAAPTVSPSARAATAARRAEPAACSSFDGFKCHDQRRLLGGLGHALCCQWPAPPQPGP